MSSKADYKGSSANDAKDNGKESYEDEGKWDTDNMPPPTVNVLAIEIKPSGIASISSPLDIKISFEVDRDCIASFWTVKFLVDSADKRIIRVSLY